MENQAVFVNLDQGDDPLGPRPASRHRPRSMIPVVLSIIGLLHVYIGFRLLPALGLSPPGLLTGALLLLVSTLLIPSALLAPFWSGRFAKTIENTVVWVGLIVGGLASSLLVLTLLRDGLLLLVWLGLGASELPVVRTYSAWGVIALASLFSGLGLLNARRSPRIVEVDVPFPDLPPALHGFRIAQISDIHVGPTIRKAFLQRIVHQVNALDAHLVAITGDLVDGSVKDLAQHTAVLADLRTTYGSYFVTGNHEYYAGADAWISELRRLGVSVLQNQHVIVRHQEAAFLLAGVTDYNGGHFGESHRSDPLAALAGAADYPLKILLAHQPRSAPAAAAAGFDLQLSGHTHGGQFFPWNFFVPLQQPFTAGLHRLNGLWVYTSRGTGYWGPPKRLGAPAEITLLRLVAADLSAQVSAARPSR